MKTVIRSTIVTFWRLIWRKELLISISAWLLIAMIHLEAKKVGRSFCHRWRRAAVARKVKNQKLRMQILTKQSCKWHGGIIICLRAKVMRERFSQNRIKQWERTFRWLINLIIQNQWVAQFIIAQSRLWRKMNLWVLSNSKTNQTTLSKRLCRWSGRKSLIKCNQSFQARMMAAYSDSCCQISIYSFHN